jgi:polynucleotide 5'-hydroxyl-kinase GRC3/NOL9
MIDDMLHAATSDDCRSNFSPMISAVAARKAALAAQKLPIEESSPNSIPIPPPTPARINSKRKSSSQPEKKISKKLKSKSTSRNQSSTDVFKDQEDVIVMDLEDEEDMSEDSDEGSLDGQSLGERAQSVGDSSDDSMEADNEGAAQFDILSFFNSRAHQEPQEDLDENRLLSTFEPSLDQNMFFLTAKEQSTLNLSDRATLIALNAQDSLCLLGTCNLTILHGSITLCGITLLASSTKHPIYAPRSSPLPIIRASSKTASALKPETLSRRLVNILEFKAVIILQELRTNVEDLGRICRSFEGVFEPTKWQKNVANESFEVPGLYMV